MSSLLSLQNTFTFITFSAIYQWIPYSLNLCFLLLNNELKMLVKRFPSKSVFRGGNGKFLSNESCFHRDDNCAMASCHHLKWHIRVVASPLTCARHRKGVFGFVWAFEALKKHAFYRRFSTSIDCLLLKMSFWGVVAIVFVSS